MSKPSNTIRPRVVVPALAMLLLIGSATAQTRATVGSASAESPFAPLEGSWSGAGTIDLANGKHEPIRCRASYDVLKNQSKLQLNLHCASAAGTLSGKVEGAGFRVVAKGPSFDADLNLVTTGDKQAVSIKSKDAQAEVRGATITLRRG